MKAIGYIRVSTSKQIEGESLDNQKESILNYCKSNNLKLMDIYSDEGISGITTVDRPELMKLLENAKLHKFDEVIVYSISRFGRSSLDLLSNIEYLKNLNINFVSIKEKFDVNSPIGKIVYTVLSAFVEFERNSLITRMSENRDSKWKKKEIFVGKIPFGYIWNKKTNELEINEKESELFKNLVVLYLYEGMSLTDIAIYLRENNIYKKNKNKKIYLNSTSLSYLFKNPVYKGEYITNKHCYKKGQRTGELKKIDDNIKYEVPAIISVDIWDKLQAKLEFNRTKSKRSEKTNEFFLRDILYCGTCGGKIKPIIKKNNNSYYCCHWRGTSKKHLLANNKERCSLPFIKQGHLEWLVLTEIIDKLSFSRNKITEGTLRKSITTKPVLENIEDLNINEKIATCNNDIIRLKKDLTHITKKKEDLMDILGSTEFNKNQFLAKMQDFDKEEIKLKSLIKSKSEEFDRIVSAKTDYEKFMEYLNTTNLEELIRKDIDNMTFENLKFFVEALIGKIEVYEHNIKGEPTPVDHFHNVLMYDNGVFMPWAIKPLKLNLNPEILLKYLPSISYTDDQHHVILISSFLNMV